MIQCILVDDEKHARKSLSGMLTENFSEVEILSECENIAEAVKAIHRYKPQVVFLDVEMPGQNGFALLDYFNEYEIDFHIIFVTAYSEYSLQAFEMSAIDYVLKPVKMESIAKALKKIPNPSFQKLNILRYNLSESSEKKLILQTAESIYVVNISDIVVIQAEGNYSKIYTTSHAVLTITKKISEFEYLETLDIFFRCHRSYIINLTKISKVDKRDYVIMLSNGEKASLAHDKKQVLLERIERL
jgi:two-component system LytT family response regulator